MLKEIFRALRGVNELSEMIGQLGQMLDIGQGIFERAFEVLMRSAEWSKVSDELYANDKSINEIERKIREQIITHLSVGHQSDMAACLVLMSVVKDAERIGDYGKNIFEIGKFYRHEYHHPEFSKPLHDIRTEVLSLFPQAKQAFMDADKDIAYKVLDEAGGITKKCDLIVQQLLSVEDQIAADEAVAHVLTARFCKRVAAHLSNIATSVVSPIPMLDYRGKLPED